MRCCTGLWCLQCYSCSLLYCLNKTSEKASSNDEVSMATPSIAYFTPPSTGKFRAFNYLDTLIHYMLNLSLKPGEPVNKIEDHEEIKEHLEKFPKPSLPKHKIWSRHKAATLIQKNVRGWLVRKRPEVNEMRQFWEVMREELKTRKGPVIPRPLVSRLSDILPSELEISSDAEGTDYIDDRPFSPKEEDWGYRLEQLKILTEKPFSKTHSKHKSLFLREKSRVIESNFREAMVQTEPKMDAGKMNPFEQCKFGTESSNAQGTNGPESESNYKPAETKKDAQKPEISQQDIEVAISFEDINNEKKKQTKK